MADADDDTLDDLPILKKGGLPIALPPEPTLFQYSPGMLEVTPEPNTRRVSAIYRYDVVGTEQTVECLHHDLSAGPLTIGRGNGRKRGNTLSIPDLPKLSSISGDQATIFLDPKGIIRYQHEGRHDIPNPLDTSTQLPPPMAWAIEPEGGSGGGFTHENKGAGNSRATNEDRGIVTHAPALSDTEATRFLADLHREMIIPRTTAIEQGGSTLSIAMHTADGHFACSQVGDSPIYVIAQHQQSGDIRLLEVTIPHNRLGNLIRRDLAQLTDEQRPTTRNMDSIIAAIEPIAPQHAKALRNYPKGLESKAFALYKNLGRECPDSSPDVFIVDAAAECPPGFEPKGMLVASDGINYGVHYGEVQKALAPLYANGANPSPAAVSEAAVQIARHYSNDNITAAILPGEGLIAVADGNGSTAELAQTAIEAIRELCDRSMQVLPTDRGVIRDVSGLGRPLNHQIP